MIAGAAQVRFVDVKRRVEFARESVFLAPVVDGPVPVNWDDAAIAEFAVTELAPEPPAGAS